MTQDNRNVGPLTEIVLVSRDGFVAHSGQNGWVHFRDSRWIVFTRPWACSVWSFRYPRR